jgi:hypothetical protein
MLDLEIVLLEQHLPSRVLTGEVRGLHDPQQRLVIRNQREVRAVQMLAKRTNRPRKRKKLTLVTRVILLMLIERPGDTST